MFYINPIMIDALVAEKQQKPLIIEGMIVERSSTNRPLRQRANVLRHRAAEGHQS